MKFRTIAGCALLAVAACSDATDINTENLAGDWLATEYSYAETAGANQSVDLIADSSYVVLLRFNQDLSGQATFTQGGSNNSSSFTWALDGSEVVMVGDTLNADLDQGGNVLTLIGDVAHDFDGDDLAEPAELRVVLTRVEQQ